MKTRFALNIKKGPGQYVLNNSLLDDNLFVGSIRNIISDFEDSFASYGSYRLLWDFLKMTISSFSPNYSMEKARNRRK